MRPLAHVLVAVLGVLLTAVSCGGGRRPVDPSPICSTSVEPSSTTVAHQGGNFNVTVSASAPTCTWSAAVDVAWITIVSGATGQGSGILTFAVTANESPNDRSATIRIAGVSHVVLQTGRPPECHYGIDPREASFGSAGGDGRLSVSATEGCSWTAESGAAWIVLTSDPHGNGNGDLFYRVEPNDHTAGRSATITVANETLVLTQAGITPSCRYRVTPVEFSPCMAGGTLQARIETSESCSWTVGTDSSWLDISSRSSGQGAADVRISYSDNYDAPREGLVKVRWPTPSAGQNLRVAQAGCRYGVSTTRLDVPAAGGSATFDVTQQSDPSSCGGPKQNACVWSAVSGASWVVVTSPMPRMGDGRVTLTIAAHSGNARSTTIRVRDRTVRINQAGG